MSRFTRHLLAGLAGSLLALCGSAAMAGGGLTIGDALSTGPFIPMHEPMFVGEGPFDGDPPPPGHPCSKVVRDGPTGDGRMAHWSALRCYDAAGRPYIVRGSERIESFY